MGTLNNWATKTLLGHIIARNVIKGNLAVLFGTSGFTSSNKKVKGVLMLLPKAI